MIKEIRYTGVTATPSDYISPDGELDAAINLVPENGELVVEQGGEVKDTLGDGDEVVCVHDVNSGIKHLIIKNGNSLYYRLYGETEKKLIKTYESGAFKCSVMGNVLCVYGIGEIEHFLWTNDEYKAFNADELDVSILFGVDVGDNPIVKSKNTVGVIANLWWGKIGKWETVHSYTAKTNESEEIVITGLNLQPQDENGKAITYRIKPVFDTTDMDKMDDDYVYYARANDKSNVLHFGYGMMPQFTAYEFYASQVSGTAQPIQKLKITEEDTDLEFLKEVKIERLVEEYSVGHSTDNKPGYSDGYNMVEGNPFMLMEENYYGFRNLIKGKVEGQGLNGWYGYFANERSDNQVLAVVNSIVSEQTSGGKFTMPFFLRYGFRAITGDIICASAPILIEPNSGNVTLGVTGLTSMRDTEDYFNTGYSKEYPSLYEASVSASLFSGELKYHVRDKEKMKKVVEHGGLIESLVIAVTDPIYTFKQGATSDEMERESYVSQSSPNNDSYSINGIKQSGTSGSVFLNLPTHGDYEKQLTRSSVFHIIKEIPAREIAVANNGASETDIKNWSSVLEDFDRWKLASLGSMLELMPDNIQNLSTYDAEYVFAYNQREHIVGGSKRGYAGFDLDAMCGYVPDKIKSTNYEVVLSSEYEHIVRGKKTESGKNRRWVYFPNSKAKELTTYGSNNDWWKVSLKEHPLLSGAYHFGGEDSSGVGVGEENLNKDRHVVSEEHHNMIEVSAQASPTVIEQTLSVGDGQLLAATSNTVALAQEQFGNSPIYVFSTEGVWVIEVSSDGKYSSRKPVSRDVCINLDSIVQIDNAVIFNTDRGIMLLSGSESICISDAIDSPAAFTTDILPKLGNLPHGAVGIASDIVPFREFLKQSRMLYDYNNQRIIVYNPEQIYAYVYSLKSKQWGMMESNIKYGINSYPECLAVDDENNIVNMSKVELEEGTKDCLIISRPLKLDDGDLLKTIDTIITRGKFRKGAVKTILYGSRDLFSWHLVASSVDHYLRGFRGTPYKYFRIVLACDLQKDESIFGSTIQYTPRLVDKIR